jgi:hypothetical protein
MFLTTLFADSQPPGDLNGFLLRDPYWICPGWEVNGTVLWGQPEILLYDLPPCEDSRCGIGYPDFVEVASGIYLSETDKAVSRVHPLPPDMLAKMWAPLYSRGGPARRRGGAHWPRAVSGPALGRPKGSARASRSSSPSTPGSCRAGSSGTACPPPSGEQGYSLGVWGAAVLLSSRAAWGARGVAPEPLGVSRKD